MYYSRALELLTAVFCMFIVKCEINKTYIDILIYKYLQFIATIYSCYITFASILTAIEILVEFLFDVIYYFAHDSII